MAVKHVLNVGQSISYLFIKTVIDPFAPKQYFFSVCDSDSLINIVFYTCKEVYCFKFKVIVSILYGMNSILNDVMYLIVQYGRIHGTCIAIFV